MGADPLSDVDVVSLEPASVVLSALVDALSPDHLCLVMHWEYDRGGLTSFWVDPSGLRGVQLDILHDPAGRGRYGLRTEEALRGAVRGSRYQKLNDADRLCYLAVKRYRKGDTDEVARIAQTIRQTPLGAQGGSLSRRGKSALTRALRGQVMGGLAKRLQRSSEYASGRAIRRLRYPVGVVVVLEGSHVAELRELASKVSRVLPGAVVLEQPSPKSLAVAYQSRYRPYVVLQARRYLRPDIAIEWCEESEMPSRLVRAMTILEADRLQALCGGGA